VPPKKQRGPKVNLHWRDDFLSHYQQFGGLYKAAESAGINSTTVYDEMARNPTFKAAADEARQRFLDTRVANLARLADQGNVVGDIVLLKAGRPAEYVEKNLSITASFSAELDTERAAQLLAAMLPQLTAASMQQLAPPAPPTP
jgi:DNA-binding phage protein